MFNTTRCNYFRCLHQGLDRTRCREILRQRRITELDHIVNLALEEKVQLLMDRFRSMDLLFPPDQESDSPATPE